MLTLDRAEVIPKNGIPNRLEVTLIGSNEDFNLILQKLTTAINEINKEGYECKKCKKKVPEGVQYCSEICNVSDAP